MVERDLERLMCLRRAGLFHALDLPGSHVLLIHPECLVSCPRVLDSEESFLSMAMYRGFYLVMPTLRESVISGAKDWFYYNRHYDIKVAFGKRDYHRYPGNHDLSAYEMDLTNPFVCMQFQD